jgi:alpha-galactosidase
LAGLCLLAAISTPALARPSLPGVWLFDNAPSYPGVTMMEVAKARGGIGGTVTTSWYGPMQMQNARLSGDVLTFELRNLNAKAHPTRRWTARLTPQGVALAGDIWYAHVEQSGRRGTAKDAKARAFDVVPLPPLGALPPDNLAKTPPMGWSSWNKFAEHIDYRTIRAMADALVETGLRDAGYVYVNIDDGWQGKRDASGVLHPNERFPDMKALADYVHSKGLKLGLYSSPGPKTCAGYEGSYGHVRQDAKTFAEWGIDYLKYDLCSGEWFYDDADTVKRAYYEMGAALRATGRPIIYSLCEYGRFDVASWGQSVGGHLWRTTGDITDDYAKMAEIGFDKNPKFPHQGPGGWNDPDMLEVGNGGMSEDEYVTHMTLWAMQAAPLIMGHDLRQTSASASRILSNRNVIAIDQDPKGAQGRAIRKQGDVVIWRKELADGSVALALFNRGAASAGIEIHDEDAGLGRIAAALDLWRGASVPSDQRRFEVPAHGAVMLRLSADQPTPPLN